MSDSKRGVSGTLEWSSSSVNCMIGCSNDCLYCYAKAQAIRFKRRDSHNWSTEIDPPAKRYGKRRGVIMFPTTHDLTCGNIHVCEEVVVKLLKAGNQLLIVSKPDPAVIKRLCNRIWSYANGCGGPGEQDVRDRVLFRFTIGSRDSRILKFWEPNAPSYEARLYSLMWCHKHGWQTSVSMEPMLNAHHAYNVAQVLALTPYVTDSIWLGLMNKPAARLSLNHGGTTPKDVATAAYDLVQSQAPEHILALYDRLKDEPKVRWKESIKKIVGIDVPTTPGLDI